MQNMDKWKKRSVWAAAGVLSLSVVGGMAFAAPDMPAANPPAAAAPAAVAAPVAAPPAAIVADPAAKMLLDKTMQRYAAMNTLSMTSTQTTHVGDTPERTQTRTIAFARPKKFKVVTTMPTGTGKVTLVSDGENLLTYATGVTLAARRVPLPEGVGVDVVAQGTPLGVFLGNAAGAQRLLGDDPKVAFLPDTTVGDVPCRVITFNISQAFGSTQVAIGKDDGLVHRISYDLVPLLAQIRAQQPDAPTTAAASETFSQIVVDAPAMAADFSTEPPAGVQVNVAPPPQAEPGPPVPLGTAAPDFSIGALVGGQTVKLSDLRGKVVLLDFWATWCPPCRRSLPDTQNFYQQYGDKGLAVLAISAEAPATITNFINQNHYTFPTYVDANGTVNHAFGIQGIPSFAIIDREGKLRAFFVGLQEDGTIQKALHDAGLDIPAAPATAAAPAAAAG